MLTETLGTFNKIEFTNIYIYILKYLFNSFSFFTNCEIVGVYNGLIIKILALFVTYKYNYLTVAF